LALATLPCLGQATWFENRSTEPWSLIVTDRAGTVQISLSRPGQAIVRSIATLPLRTRFTIQPGTALGLELVQGPASAPGLRLEVEDCLKQNPYFVTLVLGTVRGGGQAAQLWLPSFVSDLDRAFVRRMGPRDGNHFVFTEASYGLVTHHTEDHTEFIHCLQEAAAEGLWGWKHWP
jgi:hypothetical protein